MFWYYDDTAPVVRIDKAVGEVKPREVYMLVYCRSGGSAQWSDMASAGDGDIGGVGDRGGASSSGVGLVGREHGRAW